MRVCARIQAPYIHVFKRASQSRRGSNLHIMLSASSKRLCAEICINNAQSEVQKKRARGAQGVL